MNVNDLQKGGDLVSFFVSSILFFQICKILHAYFTFTNYVSRLY